MSGRPIPAVSTEVGTAPSTTAPQSATRGPAPAGSDASRRSFLVATGATAAAGLVVAGAVGPGFARPAASAKALTTPADAQPLVVHVSDPASGRLSVYVGEREVLVNDPDLVARITRAVEGK
ncbi:hypothetical protein M6D93_16270 [Jatrophihabitans telluris]|uniref:Twin-arginine translocation signal domain-containing protein n=1 Tax=Jatrophihabitans telluris TaxID=2038343 RepID=A0ABY4QW00_9ACTN|nr:hypothetical protein [Jatrophihabitans telluris]UQX87843.1 hypothetical protein M6D93_16270 [Jatrophihabitans telluris]